MRRLYLLVSKYRELVNQGGARLFFWRSHLFVRHAVIVIAQTARRAPAPRSQAARWNRQEGRAT